MSQKSGTLSFTLHQYLCSELPLLVEMFAQGNALLTAGPISLRPLFPVTWPEIWREPGIPGSHPIPLPGGSPESSPSQYAWSDFQRPFLEPVGRSSHPDSTLLSQTSSGLHLPPFLAACPHPHRRLQLHAPLQPDHPSFIQPVFSKVQGT